MLSCLLPVHLFIKPESQDHRVLIQGVGCFSKYERKQPETTLAHSEAYKPSYCNKRISFLFTRRRETKWLYFLALRDLAHRLRSVPQDSRAECRLCAQPLPPWPGSWMRATLGRALWLGLQNRPWRSEREGGLASLLASSLAFLSLWGPIQAAALGMNLNLTINSHLLFFSL